MKTKEKKKNHTDMKMNNTQRKSCTCWLTSGLLEVGGQGR